MKKRFLSKVLAAVFISSMVLSAKGWAGHGYTIELSADNQ